MTPRRYQTVRDAQGRLRLELPDPPANCVTLPMAPGARESDLDGGEWLIYCYAIWSGPDIAGIGRVLQFAESHPEAYRIGIRPFEQHDEFDVWCEPGSIPRFVSPIWIRISQGAQVDVDFGSKAIDAIRWLCGLEEVDAQ